MMHTCEKHANRVYVLHEGERCPLCEAETVISELRAECQFVAGLRGDLMKKVDEWGEENGRLKKSVEILRRVVDSGSLVRNDSGELYCRFCGSDSKWVVDDFTITHKDSCPYIEAVDFLRGHHS